VLYCVLWSVVVTSCWGCSVAGLRIFVLYGNRRHVVWVFCLGRSSADPVCVLFVTVCFLHGCISCLDILLLCSSRGCVIWVVCC